MNTVIDSAYLAAEATGRRITPVSDWEQVMMYDVIQHSTDTRVELPEEYREYLKLLLATLEAKGWPDCALTEVTVALKMHRFPTKHYEWVRETRAVYCDEMGTGFTSQGELFDHDLIVNPYNITPSTRDSLMVTIDDMLYMYGLSDD